MIIDQVYIKNFGIYRGEHRLDLSPPAPDKPIVLFAGLNGRGKTTLIDAILLAFYGQFARCSNRKRKAYKNFLSECVNRGAPDKAAAVGVRFRVFGQGEVEHFELLREWTAQDGAAIEKLTTRRRSGADKAFSDDPILREQWGEYVENLVPSNIANLFFFDGEKIEELADLDNASHIVESALHGLLGLDLVEQLEKDLITLERRKKSEVSSDETAAAIRELQDEISELETELSNLKQQRAQALSQRDRAQTGLENAEKEYRRKGGDQFERKRHFSQELKELNTEKDRLELLLAELAAGDAPLTLVPDLLGNVAIQDSKERAATSSRTVLSILEDRDTKLLASLGGKLSKGDLLQVEDMLLSDQETHKAATQIKSYLNLSSSASERLQRLLQALPVIRDQFRKVCKDIADAEERIAQMERRIQSVPSEERIKPTREKWEKYQKNLKGLDVELCVLDEKKETLANKLSMARVSLLKRMEENIHGHMSSEDDGRIVRFSEQTRATLQAFKTEIVKQHLSDIEQRLSTCFRQLVAKEHLIERISISPGDFSVQPWDATKTMVHPDLLSAGERQLLAISILWALGQAAENPLPVVVDTPLGRLDGKHRTNLLTHYFPNASHQVIVLATDQEIGPEEHELLAPHIGREYSLIYDEETQATEIAIGYAFTEEELKLCL